jgi:hypothetical protein
MGHPGSGDRHHRHGAIQARSVRPVGHLGGRALHRVGHGLRGGGLRWGRGSCELPGPSATRSTTRSAHSSTAPGRSCAKILVDGKVTSVAHATGAYNIADCEIDQNPLSGTWEDTNSQ